MNINLWSKHQIRPNLGQSVCTVQNHDLVCLSADMKFQYRSHTSCWLLSLEKERRALCSTIPMGVLWDQGREEILYTRVRNVCREGFIRQTNSLHQGRERLSRGLYMPHKFSTPGMGNGCPEGFKCPTKSFSLALPRQPQLDLKFNKSHV